MLFELLLLLQLLLLLLLLQLLLPLVLQAAAAVIASSNWAQLIIFVGVLATESGVNATGDNMPGASSCNVGGGCRNIFLPPVAATVVAAVAVALVALAAICATSIGTGGGDIAGPAQAPVANGLSNSDGNVCMPATVAPACTSAAATGCFASMLTYVRL